jgi:bifunctional oligoribonuclease and PAP phosphatase NrnA
MFTTDQDFKISELLSSNCKVVIVVHRNPDGDALGSSLGLQNYLRNAFQINAEVIVPDPFPDFLGWMPGSETIIIGNKQKEETNLAFQQADLIFCLDFNHPARTDQLEESIINSKAYKVMIDHHREPDNFCDAMLSDISASSTCELVLRWILHKKGESYVDKDAASCLYTGMMTDTGSFRFQAATATTYHYAGLLIEKGVQHWLIHEAISNQNSFYKLKLWGLALHEKLVYMPEFRTAFIALSEQDLKQYNYKEGDLEGLVNYALSIKGVLVAALFSERGGKIRISFRSIGEFPVNELSRDNFEGGGHLNAAGGVSYLGLPETIEKFKSILPRYNQLSQQ